MFLHNFFEIFIINWLKFLEFCGIIHSYSYELCEKKPANQQFWQQPIPFTIIHTKLILGLLVLFVNRTDCTTV